MPDKNGLTAKIFLSQLSLLKSIAELKNVQRFFSNKEDPANKFLAVRMGVIFDLAKHFIDMPLNEIEILIQSEYYEARMGAASIMDFQARSKKTTGARKKELFDLYLRRHDKINNWDLVDRSAPYVVGGYLFDKSRKILYKLARSRNVWERRTAIVSTYFFIRQNDLSDTFHIAEILVNDSHDLIQKQLEAGSGRQEKEISWL
ncbi:MAG: DNA alkylation repair protein [Ferruginibacter sp.]